MDHPLPPALLPLATLLERCEAERDTALARQAQAQQVARQIQAQQEHLDAWRQGCRDHWQAQFRQSAQMEIVHSYQAYMGRLEHALQQLSARRDQNKLEIEHARLLVLSCEKRAASVRKLLERRLQEQQQQAQRRQQRDTDEHAAAMHRRAAAARTTQAIH